MKIGAGVAEKKKNTIFGRTLYKTAVAVEGLPAACRPQIQIDSNTLNFEFFRYWKFVLITFALIVSVAILSTYSYIPFCFLRDSFAESVHFYHILDLMASRLNCSFTASTYVVASWYISCIYLYSARWQKGFSMRKKEGLFFENGRFDRSNPVIIEALVPLRRGINDSLFLFENLRYCSTIVSWINECRQNS